MVSRFQGYCCESGIPLSKRRELRCQFVNYSSTFSSNFNATNSLKTYCGIKCGKWKPSYLLFRHFRMVMYQNYSTIFLYTFLDSLYLIVSGDCFKLNLYFSISVRLKIYLQGLLLLHVSYIVYCCKLQKYKVYIDNANIRR